MLNGSPASRTRSGEEGQVLIMWILIATIIFVIGAIVVDFGLWFTERRRAQTAADLAAIAAATKLNDSDSETISLGLEYADRNGFEDGVNNVNVVVTPQYNGNPELVEVTVEDDAPVLFLDIFGVAGNIGARAVAELTEQSGTGTEYAIFAYEDNGCQDPPPLEISGSTNVAVGAVHSNSDLKINGSDNDFIGGPVSYGDGCSVDLSGSNNTFPQGDPSDGGFQPMPLDYEYDDFPCDHEFTSDVDLTSQNDVWMDGDPDTKVLKSWVICSTGNLTLSSQGVSGNVTLVAGGRLTLNGSDFNLVALWNDVLAFSAINDDAAIDMSGSGGNWTGFIFAPLGKTKIQGSGNLSIHGSIIADRVIVSGSNFSIDATGFPVTIPQPPTIRLVE